MAELHDYLFRVITYRRGERGTRKAKQQFACQPRPIVLSFIAAKLALSVRADSAHLSPEMAALPACTVVYCATSSLQEHIHEKVLHFYAQLILTVN